MRHHRSSGPALRAATLRQQYPILLLLAALAIGARGAAAQQTVIVAFKPDAVAAAAAVSAASADAQVAAAAAGAAAQARGASAAKQAVVAKLAAEAAAAQAAVASLSAEVKAAAATAGVAVTQTAAYSTVLQGAAYSAPDAAAAAELKQRLEQRPDVAGVYYARDVEIIAPVDPSKAPASAAAGAAAAKAAAATAAAAPPSARLGAATSGYAAATGLQALSQQTPGLNGTGTLVCIVDTGVAYRALLGCSGVNQPEGSCPLVTGYDFVGNAYNGRTRGKPPVQDADPDDCMGHGTMVASVAASSNGVAQGARLGAYKVFGCTGVSTDDIIIAAIDRAVQDGCDIINLSLASGSGYADRSVYGPVMQAALAKGVLVVKAAGNKGNEDGAFQADVATAAGAIAVAAVDAYDSGSLQMAFFSSYGPSPALTMTPHVGAPGRQLSVITQDGGSSSMDGTSFSSPYVAGVLALWLQHKQQVAAASGQPLDPASVNQDAAMRALMATAAGIRDPYRSAWRQPVPRMGAGVIQADALLMNQLSIDPPALSLPSGLTGTFTTSITLRWNAPRNPSKTMVTYSLRHEPATALDVTDGWYRGGWNPLPSLYQAAQVSFSPSRVSFNSGIPGASKTVQVTFTFPSGLTSRELLYSGIIRVVPFLRLDPNATLSRAVWPLSLPYMGYTRDWSSVRVMARPLAGASDLRRYQNTFCYAPRSQPQSLNLILNNPPDGQFVEDVCTGGSSAGNATLAVSLGVLQSSPECSLRLVLVPEVPIQWLYFELLDDASGASLGFADPLDVSSGDSKSDAYTIGTYCLRFDGSFRPTDGGERRWLQAGSAYRANAIVTGPLAQADAALGKTARNTTVPIRGKLQAIA